jgi:LAO/AO transport system kinase
LKTGDRRAVAEAITLLERGDWDAAAWEALPAPAARSFAVGITGAGGAGKSTLIAALVPLLRSRNLTVAVLASDPSSPVSGGALLGDRVRLEYRPDDPGFYFRSLATRGHAGGISGVVGSAVQLLRRVPFDVILVETVGVGQDQYAVREFVDKLLLVLTPLAGDEIQLQKAGVIELADVIAVNKSDLPGADIFIALLRECLGTTPVIPVVATAPQGLERLWETIRAEAPQETGA